MSFWPKPYSNVRDIMVIEQVKMYCFAHFVLLLVSNPYEVLYSSHQPVVAMENGWLAHRNSEYQGSTYQKVLLS